MQYQEATELELRLAECTDRCARELPAGELETTIEVCLSDAVNELQRLRTQIKAAYCDLERGLVSYPRSAVPESPWSRHMTIEQKTAGQIWVRWTGADGIYRWLHPIDKTWIEEPNQIDMPLFPSFASAMLAARRSPKPPAWEEFKAFAASLV